MDFSILIAWILFFFLTGKVYDGARVDPILDKWCRCLALDHPCPLSVTNPRVTQRPDDSLRRGKETILNVVRIEGLLYSPNDIENDIGRVYGQWTSCLIVVVGCNGKYALYGQPPHHKKER